MNNPLEIINAARGFIAGSNPFRFPHQEETMLGLLAELEASLSPVEEIIVEELIVEEPIIEEPTVEEEIIEEVVEEPTIEEPVAEEIPIETPVAVKAPKRNAKKK